MKATDNEFPYSLSDMKHNLDLIERTSTDSSNHTIENTSNPNCSTMDALVLRPQHTPHHRATSFTSTSPILSSHSNHDDGLANGASHIDMEEIDKQNTGKIISMVID